MNPLTVPLESLDEPRRYAAQLMRAAMRAGDAYEAVRRFLDGERMPGSGVWLFGAGKAATSMARAVLDTVSVKGGLLVTKDGHGEALAGVEVREAAHPTLDDRSLACGRELRERMEAVPRGEHILFVLSGGASALIEELPEGLGLAALQQATDVLMARSADIQTLNTVRKHLSRLKGGQLGQRLAGRRVTQLVLSDVLGDHLDVIGSGPLVADSSTGSDAVDILLRYGLDGLVPFVAETCKGGLEYIESQVVAGPFTLPRAAAEQAERLGLGVTIVTESMVGEARLAAQTLVAGHREQSPPYVLLAGGETTVTVGPHAGLGGPCQEFAVSLALALRGRANVLGFALASDGTDGPTDGAGGWVDGSSADDSAEDALSRNDTLPWLQSRGAWLQTGPTRTNLNDLYGVLIL